MQIHALRKATSDGHSYSCEGVIKGMEKPQKMTNSFKQKSLPWLLKALSLIALVYVLFPLKCMYVEQSNILQLEAKTYRMLVCYYSLVILW